MKSHTNTEVTNSEPMADHTLVSLHRQLGDLERENRRLDQVLQVLDHDDAQHFAEGDTPEANHRLRQRFEAEANKRQIDNRVRGAKEAVQRRESELVVQQVEAIRTEVDTVLDEMATLAAQIDSNLDSAVRDISRMLRQGQHIVQKLRDVRGRSTITPEGHISAGDITSIASMDNLRFLVERHMAGSFVGWRTEHGVAGPNFAQTMGSQIQMVRSSIDHLMDIGAFDRKAKDFVTSSLLIEEN